MTVSRDPKKKLTPTSETVKKTLGLLDVLSGEKREWYAAEIAQAAKLPVSTVFRLLTTLVQLRFIDYDAPTRRYRLGLKLLELGYRVSEGLDLPALANPVLRRLSDKSGETAHLSIRDGDEGVFVAKVETHHSVRMHTALGRRVPLHAGASMKTLLAFLPDAEVEAYIRDTFGSTHAQIAETQRLWQAINAAREKGYCFTRSEQTPGAAGVGAPVRDHTGRVVAALTISGPEARFTAEKVAQFGDLVRDAARELSAELGCV